MARYYRAVREVEEVEKLGKCTVSFNDTVLGVEHDAKLTREYTVRRPLRRNLRDALRDKDSYGSGARIQTIDVDETERGRR